MVEPLFEEMFEQGVASRVTSVTLLKLIALTNAQMELFEPWPTIAKSTKIYDNIDVLRQRYGNIPCVWG